MEPGPGHRNTSGQLLVSGTEALRACERGLAGQAEVDDHDGGERHHEQEQGNQRGHGRLLGDSPVNQQLADVKPGEYTGGGSDAGARLDSVHRELSPGYTERMLALAARCIDDEATMRAAQRAEGEARAMSVMDQAELERRIDEVVAQLRERLAPEEFRLVRQLRYLEELALLGACTAWEQRCLDALALHLPEHALAIRAVAAHVRNTDAECDTLRGLPAGRQGR